jgi:NAD(P)-dependent dehydrogenase (short-subunit alcohol dehydrogenase family)
MSVLDLFRLEGRSALITGGSKGLGRAMAVALAEAGADVAVCSRTAGEAAEVAAEIAQQTGRTVIGVEADVTDKASITAMVAQCDATFGKIDILINNAGVNVRKPTSEVTEEDWDSVVDITVKGSFLCSQALLPGMMERKWGRIVMLGSIMTHVAIPGRAAYASAKAGVLGLTKALALEAASSGVTVNCLCPGVFATPMNLPLMNDPVAFQTFLGKIPMGRWAQPEELGGVVVYLCSEASQYMTGTTLTVDGGWTAQ